MWRGALWIGVACTKLSRMSHDTTPPPDRRSLLTEQRLPASRAIDAMSVREVLEVINDADASIAGVVRTALDAIAQVVTLATRSLKQGGRLIYLGAGTSGRLGVLDAAECPPTFHCDPNEVVGVIAGGDAALRRSSEGMEDDPHGAREALEALAVGVNDTVLGIAAGGTTSYVWGGLQIAQSRGAKVAMLMCVPLADLPEPAAGVLRKVDAVIELPVGAEVITGSTRMKAGTATKMALNMISTATMVQRGKVWGNLMVDVRATNAKLRDRAARILEEQCDLDREAALRLLDEAQGRVKLALVMAKRGVTRDEAQTLLDQHQQQLRPILGEPKWTIQ